MNRTNQISFYKNQLKTAKQLKEVASQSLSIATQIESEAKSALELLGAKLERTRKGKVELSESMKLKLSASLTNTQS